MGDGAQDAAAVDAAPDDADHADAGAVDTSAAIGDTTQVDAGSAPDVAGNKPPTVKWLEPASGSLVQLGATVKLVAEVADDGTAPADLGLSLTLTNAAAPADAYPEADAKGRVEISTAKLPAGKNTLVLKVYDDFGASATASLVILVNTAPGAPVVAIKPEQPTGADDLTAVIVQPAVDPDDGPLPADKHAYVWRRGTKLIADLKGPVVPAARTKAGDLWSVYVTATDGSVAGTEATASVTVDNSAPPKVKLTLKPAAPTVASTLECIIDGPAKDADGDKVSHLVRWTLGGKPLPRAGTATTLVLASKDSGAWKPMVEVEVGDVLGCRVNPTDGLSVGVMSEVTVTLASFDPCAEGAQGCPATTVCKAGQTAAAMCPCAPGYDAYAGVCHDADECLSGTATCDKNATGGNKAGGYDCVCDKGWAGDGGKAGGCKDVDDCQSGSAFCDI